MRSGISVLARHVQLAGVELVLAHRNSSQALSLLKQGRVHIAARTCGRQGPAIEHPEITRLFPKKAVAVISFAVWRKAFSRPEATRKNPRNRRPGPQRCLHRQPGTGSGQPFPLGLHLARLKIDASKLTGYKHLASGHLPAAWQVRTGAADCCIAYTRCSAPVWPGF